MIEEHDNKTQRCRKLGHEVSFRYCRGGAGNEICRSILDCWWEIFDVRSFMRENMPEQLDHIEKTPPPSKINTILDLIEQAKKQK